MKKSLVAAALVLGLTCSGCLGPDNLYRSVKNWNVNLSEKAWVNEAVFIGLIIIPVYEFALLGDYLVFNTVTYWSDEPMIKEPGAFPEFKKAD